jgi:hypothetical protein
MEMMWFFHKFFIYFYFPPEGNELCVFMKFFFRKFVDVNFIILLWQRSSFYRGLWLDQMMEKFCGALRILTQFNRVERPPLGKLLKFRFSIWLWSAFGAQSIGLVLIETETNWNFHPEYSWTPRVSDFWRETPTISNLLF